MYLNSRVPKKVHGLDNVKVVKIACGYNHCLALSGRTTSRKYDPCRDVSQLGNKELELTKNYAEPVKVDFDEPVLDICSKKHWNMATTANHFYVWGKNKGGAIAERNAKSDVPSIHHIFDGKKIVSMSAGYSHAIVATGMFNASTSLLNRILLTKFH
eukprot:TRINITY_DN1845_c0_g1_i2.p1 TRINITY_DN1845_c0_g1~~TRINITY_DN1845_c0_g1_i2.p1  ORF type:complete len:157 (-),score=44.41 TRINITY_DN1845_c0_g1_i2:345-815(-)